jgi:putative hemolysin
MINSFAQIVIIFLMLLLNAVFAAYEMALASVSQSRLNALSARQVKGGAEAAFMKSRIEASLAVIQMGITLVAAIAAATGGLSAVDSFAPWLVKELGWHKTLAGMVAVIIVVIPLSSVTIIFAELVPKMLALNYRERVCLRLSPLMKRLFLFLHPVVNVFERIVKWLVQAGSRHFPGRSSAEESPGLHELQAAAALARTARLIGAHQEKILLSAAQLSARQVREILIPLSEVSTIPSTFTLSQALVRAHLDMHTRFPVCRQEGDSQSIDGYVNFKDIISALRLNPEDPSVCGIVRPLKSVEAERTISAVLEIMIQEKMHIILVCSRGGRYLGIVTLEDIIEELVGEIEDEFDRLPAYIHAFAGGWIVGGGTLMENISGAAGLSGTFLPGERLADWCLRQIPGGNLEGGQTIEADGLRVSLRKFRRHKVSEAAIARTREGIKDARM